MKTAYNYLLLLVCPALWCQACNDDEDVGRAAAHRPMLEKTQYTVIADNNASADALTLRWYDEPTAQYVITLTADRLSDDPEAEPTQVSASIPSSEATSAAGIRSLTLRQKQLTDLAVKAGADLQTEQVMKLPMTLTVEALQADGTPYPDYGTYDANTYRTSTAIDLILGPVLSLDGTPGSHKACVSVAYRIDPQIADLTTAHGLCWNTTGNPTLADSYAPGPEALSVGETIRQFVTPADLSYGTTYYFRAYALTDNGTTYSEQTEVKLADAGDIAPIALNWERYHAAGLPDNVEVYKTVSQLNGRNFSGWYAIADCSGDVELRVRKPSGVQRISQQIGEGCLVMINAGYFDMSSGAHDGVYVADGIRFGAIYSQRGDWGTGPAKDMWFSVTRSLFGVDASGKPRCCWAATTGDNDPRTILCYDRPLTSIRYNYGTTTPMARYAGISATCPSPKLDWTPEQAVSAGPMLLKNSNCMVSDDVDAEWYPITDWEMWDYYLSTSNYIRAQTAIGCTADGKVVLFTCGLNGNAGASCGGASLGETAAILKQLGCVEAIKLDGGGSAGMVICDGMDTSVSTRAVATTIGFYNKNAR